jgi:pimeloyl-ACP methyl ester carboxylesterase
VRSVETRVAQDQQGPAVTNDVERACDRAESIGKLQGAAVTVPPGMDQLLANLKRFVPGLRSTQMIAGCGHWTQQERPNEVNAAIIDFARSLPT